MLAYMIQPDDGTRLRVYVLVAPGDTGDALGREKYPYRPDVVLKDPPSRIKLRPEDRRILMALIMNQGHHGNDVVISGSTAHTIAGDMLKTERCYLGPEGGKPLRLRKGEFKAKPVWRPVAGTTLLDPTFDVPEDGRIFLPTTPPMVVDSGDKTCRPLVTGLSDGAASHWLATEPMAPNACLAFLERASERYPRAAWPAPPHMEEICVDGEPPTPELELVRNGAKTNDNPELLARLRFRYGSQEIAAHEPGDRVRVFHDGKVIDFERQHAFEAETQKRLSAFGFAAHQSRTLDLFSRANEERCLALPPESPHTWTDAIGTLFPELEAEGWEIRQADNLRLVTVSEDDWYSDFTTGAKGWLQFETGVQVDGEKVNLLPVLHRFLRERRDWSEDRLEAYLDATDVPVVTPNCIVFIAGRRLLAIIQQLFELYADTPLDGNSRLRVGEWRATELSRTAPGASWSPPPHLARLIEALTTDFHVDPLSAPAGVKGTLRAYQEFGFGWLCFLEAHQLGGVLADDMGLGKTIQTIALLQKAKHSGKLDLPVLIVAPTSVLPNWRRELERFVPGMDVHLFHGPDRHGSIQDFADTDILITSYALLRRDAKRYLTSAFSFVILDEAQAIKNPKAKVTQVACGLKARMRLCLTGTPIENHLGELWSIMHFCMPGLLGTESNFATVFRRPIEQEGNPAVCRHLQRRIAPLMLRRTKDAVAADLPPKNEIIQTVSLSDVQLDLYQTVRMAMTDRIRQEMDAKGFGRSRIIILDALLKLRQTCCDPRLRDKRRKYTLPADSCKLALLADMLPEMIEEGRRILLFSQFTTMLDLIKELLADLGVPFVEIRGSTRDRETPVTRFQNGEAPLFLLSLKAGGTGLNLTAADTVIHYDPWWNPAVETQATDRAHRIGQDKPVFVYKFVTEGTVEERILELQERKRKLTDVVEASDGESLTFSKNDLEALLADPLQSTVT